MTACSRCAVLTSPFASSGRVCGFRAGPNFLPPSVNCATMTSLCALAKSMPRTNTGFRASVLVGPDAYLALLWKKWDPAQEEILGALVFDLAGTRALTLPEADRFIEHNVPRRG